MQGIRGADQAGKMIEFAGYVVLALALTMDTLAVSVVCGNFLKEFRIREALRLGLSMAFVQGAFSLIGVLAGSFAARYLEQVDHWIAFVLLVGIGVKMIRDAYKSDDDDEAPSLALRVILLMSVATSIDSIMACAGLALTDPHLINAVPVIAVMTLLISLVGTYAGAKLGAAIGSHAGALGGIVLIGLGSRILYLHFAA